MRGLVAVVLAMLAAGCYDPEVQDCTVRCKEKDQGACAEGQVCDKDGWCASPEIAGRCDQRRDELCADGDDEACEPAPAP